MKTTAYQNVTEKIIAELEKGVAPWTKPWNADGTESSAFLLPENAHTGRRYSGINIISLWMAGAAKGYQDHRWLTFKQAKALGGTVRKGEKATKIVFAKNITKKEEDENGDEKTKGFWMLREYAVFNAEQCDGLNLDPIPENRPAEDHGDEVPEHIRAFIDGAGARINHGGDRAAYAPLADFILLPHPQAFESIDAYASTALHELAHWTGHESRLARPIDNAFGSAGYAAEELVAELTAAFLCADLGITSKLQHAEYIGHWIELLKADDRAIFTAARAAEAAATFLREQPAEQTAAKAA